MSDFIVEKLTKSVGDKTVFKEISFIIHDLDRIGIIGVNGTGKTTLLDVVSERIGFDGDVSPFTKANGYKIAYLTQEPEFDDSKTVLDTVLSSDLREMTLIREYETLMADYSEDNQSRLEKVMAEMDSLDAWSIESEVKTVLSKLGLSDLSQKVGDLSGGLRRRVQLAQVLLNDADLLLLDEPTNHLDIDTIAWLTNFLKSSKKTVLFITHDRYFLDIYRREEMDKYVKPSVTVDSVIFRYYEGRVQTLLIKRKNHPFMGKYALSGGFVQEQEDLNLAVCREVQEETSVKLNPDHIEQLITVGTPYRDPRMWTITVAYLCFMTFNDIQVEKAADDAASTHWLDIAMVDGRLQLADGEKTLSHDDLAFDHCGSCPQRSCRYYYFPLK